MEILFTSQTWPFGSALMLLVALAVLEGLGLVIGGSPSDWLDHLIPDSTDTALGWLHLGKVPILVLLVLFLAGFSLTGYVLQSLWHGITGAWLPTVFATIPAFFAGLACVKTMGGLLAHFKIGDETRAVSELSLLGRVGVISEGIARAGFAAQAKVRDELGNMHYVMVEPDLPDQVLSEGTNVLLVKKVGARYFCIVNPHPEQLQ